MKSILVFALTTTLGFAVDAHAQSYPSRPVTIVVPFPAGGSPDILARILAERLRMSLGQPVVIENVTGASGSIGTGRVARATPDGYTLGIGTLATHVVNGAALKLPYDVRLDFTPVSLLTGLPLIIVGRKNLPAENLKELIAWLQDNPGKATLGVGGLATRLAAALFQHRSHTTFELVPYRGAALALKDLVAGQIDLTIDLASNSLPQVRAGAIKAYAVAGEARLAATPEIPTTDEAGLSKFYVSTWHALFAPKSVPSAVVRKVNSAIQDHLADPHVRAKLAALGHAFFSRERQTPEALAAYQKSEIEKWWPIIKAAGLRAD